MAKTGSSKQRSKRVSRNGRRRSKQVFRIESVVVEGVTPTHRGRRVRKHHVTRGRVQLQRAFTALAKNPDLASFVVNRL